MFEQTSWMLFLKYLDDLEQDRTMEVEQLGGVARIRDAFIGFQKHLYQEGDV